MGDFKPKLAPLAPPPIEKPISPTILLAKSLLARRQKVFVIAAIQLIICTLFPGRYAVVPIATLLLSMLITKAIDLSLPCLPPPPSYSTTVVPGRASSLLPLPDGTFGSLPSSQSLVVFNLGVQFNHPRGRMCPHGKDVAEHFFNMNNNLLARREELGLISITDWDGSGSSNADTLMISYYFKNVESIHNFAHDEIHRRAWDWYGAVKPAHIGIFHETFVVPAHSYETLYVNCRPVLLGAGLVKCDGIKGDEKWRNTLVSADSVSLNSQWQRMNRDVHGRPRQ